MTDNTQEIDNILVELCKNTQADYGYQKLVPSETTKAKQAILDWHNKQTLELLDRLERVATLTETSPLTGRIYIELPLSAIEAERNKIKESTDE